MESHSVFGLLHGTPGFILLATVSQGTVLLIILLLVLLLLSFTISGAEVAIFSLNNRDVNMLKTKQHPSARKIINFLEEPREVFTSLLIASLFVNISIIILANFLINQFFSFNDLGFLIEIILKVLVIAFVLVFFGEILPKVWATQNNVRFAYGSALVVEAMHLLLRRISKAFISVAEAIGKRLGANRSEALSLRELDEAIDIKTDEEASPAEKSIMKGIVKFGTISVRQIMRSRLDVSGVDHTSDFPALIKRIEELHYSRVPVYKNSLDEIAGMINTKDILPHLEEPDTFDWHSLMRQPYFVPESKLIEDLLKDFQSKHIHFAIVVDEFGGTSGIVTMEDIIEEVIGEVHDEFDEEESRNRKLDDNNYQVEGKTMVHDLCKLMQLPMDTFDRVRGESESVGGLVLEIAGQFPKPGEMIKVGDFGFTVLESLQNRITSVKVTVNSKA